MKRPRSLSTGSGTAMHSYKDRGDDLYETPDVATRALIRSVDFPSKKIWEPACGKGAMARVFEECGFQVVGTDLVARDYGIGGIDFLMTQHAMAPVIVTNPPFKLAHQFVKHALSLDGVTDIWLLLRLAFLESERRADILDTGHLSEVLLFRKRLPFMHRDGWEGPKLSSSGMPFAWFHWTSAYLDCDPVLRRIDW